MLRGLEDDFAITRRPYLLVLNIPYFIDSEGRMLLERAWHRDLVQHLRYLPHLMLAAPLHPLPADTTALVPVDNELRATLQLFPLPSQRSRLGALVQFPWLIGALWRAVGRADIVHTGIAGWPFPLGWLASPIACLRGKKLLIVVESAPWRPLAKAATWRKKLESLAYEVLAKFWCSRADLSFYTQPRYLDQFHGSGKGPAYVVPATWVNAEEILDDAKAQLLWDAKMADPMRFLFVGRLVPEKGVQVLLEAVGKLCAVGARAIVHIMGEGPLRDKVLAAQRKLPYCLKYFKPLAYGMPFFEFLQQYHAVIVPNLGDEQPRIIFDAAARAVPVLASDTDGLRPYVVDGCTGNLVTPDDSRALADAIAFWTANPKIVRSFAIEALSHVRSKTHQAMHAKRSQIIARYLTAH